ncbi:hypothetical protein BDF21DRAFT_222803 [Thamnidium elegans]|nr:hypothetical protein BDF21DRAFT_222803 [Thamnidium elegans]
MNRITSIGHDMAMVKMDLVSVVKSRFDCLDPLMLPEVLRSRSVYITSSGVKNTLETFLKSKFFAIDPDVNRGRVIHKIIENIFKTFHYMVILNEPIGINLIFNYNRIHTMKVLVQ